MLETAKHGPDYGINALTGEVLPSPAARFACNPLLSGAEGGHNIHLRELGRRGMHLHGRLGNADDGDITFSDDLPERLATVESSFNQRMRKAIDAYIAAPGIDAEEQPPTREDDLLPSEPAQLNLPQANITSVLRATGYKLDLSFIDVPVLDEWGYPKHTAGVTEQPGLYAVGLPWLMRRYSSIRPNGAAGRRVAPPTQRRPPLNSARQALDLLRQPRRPARHCPHVDSVVEKTVFLTGASVAGGA
ncbi:hypothetical protein ACTAQJ_10655 [Arthrobacter sp. alpha11c]